MGPLLALAHVFNASISSDYCFFRATGGIQHNSLYRLLEDKAQQNCKLPHLVVETNLN